MPEKFILKSLSLQVSRSVTILWLTLSLSLLPGLAFAETGISDTTGSIHGEVLITRNLKAQKMRFRIYPGFKPIPPPTAEEKRDDEWQNVVIYLKTAPALLAATDGHPESQIAQLGETFIPHVLPIVKGSTVEFPNQDPIFHKRFNSRVSKSGSDISQRFFPVRDKIL